MIYRREIDALRGIAVLIVLFYHASIPFFEGGFVGVDVFFVISGYLITSILIEDFDEGRFSIIRFYERRARRIFPALFATILVSGLAASLIFLPPEFELFAASAIAATFFGSNFLFLSETGYFETAVELKPLLHTWSLGIEEQFYIVFPLIVYCGHRWAGKERLIVIVALLALVSFIANLLVTMEAAQTAFFSPFSRAWELLAGAMIAVTRLPDRIMPRYHDALGLLGLALIGVSVSYIDRHTLFPGLAALLPVSGSVLCILARPQPQGLVGKILYSTVLIHLGKISYSLYLIHWPLLVFILYRNGGYLSPAGTSLYFVTCGLLAFLQWKYVERPFRGCESNIRRQHIVTCSIACMTLIPAFGTLVVWSEGWPQRLPAAARSLYSVKSELNEALSSNCVAFEGTGPTIDETRRGSLCRLGDLASTRESFILWGDSHAGAIAHAVDLAAKAGGKRGMLVSRGSCPPLIGFTHWNKKKAADCKAMNLAVLDLIERRNIKLVLLHARWPQYVNGGPLGNEGPFFDPSLPFEETNNSTAVATNLNTTLGELEKLNVRVIIISGVPEIGYDVPHLLARAAIDGKERDIEPTLAAVMQRQNNATELLQSAAAKGRIELLDPKSILCTAIKCRVVKEGSLLYRDEDHLTRHGAETLVSIFLPIFLH